VKTIIKNIAYSILTVIVLTSSVFPRAFDSDSAATADSLRLITQYSLFSEYFKNKDYQSAMPYAWKVLKLNPKKFNKWIYFKMEDAFWYLHDSSNADQNEIKAINDTIRYFYNTAM